MSRDEIKGANHAVLLDCGGVLFDKNPDPQEDYKKIMDLFNGKNLAEMAGYFNVQDELERIKETEQYKSMPPQAAPYLAGELLIDKLIERKVIDIPTLIAARVDAVRMRDDQIIKTIMKNFPHLDVTIATQDGQTIHPVLDHYFPEIEERRQIVTTDSDIKAFKTTPDFYYNASKRLYLPTEKMVLVDDSKGNIQGIETAGGMGSLFDPTSDSLEDTVMEAIEKSIRRK